jgi:hypothetical protein
LTLLAQLLETFALWLRRARVRAPSVTLPYFLQMPIKEAPGYQTGGFDSSRHTMKLQESRVEESAG